MKVLRIGQLAALSLAGSLTLAACGSASNDSSSSTTSSGGNTSSSAASACAPGNLSAAGSTAQLNAMTQAGSGYKTACNAELAYNGTGSGAGITSFLSKQIDFAGSDSALSSTAKDGDEFAKAKTACGSDAIDLPMITGPIAVAFNVKGVTKLNLTASLVAKIFAGKVTTWNDKAIADANSGVTLPATPISVFFRSDSSGTTDNFTNYLNTAAPADWTDAHSKTWTGKVGQGKAKSAGVGQAIKATDGGIGYVEWSYAIQNQLPMAAIDNGAGPVELTADSAGKAVEAATIKGTGGDLSLKIDYATKAAGAYPIVLVTYEIVCTKYADAAKGAAVKSFMSYLASDAFQSSLTQIGSAPLPASILDKVKASVATIS